MRLPITLSCLVLATCLSTASVSLAQDKAPASNAANAQRVRVVTTAGSFVIELDHGRAPMTVDAFLGYVKSGFYSGTIFHRVVAGFVAQGGGFSKDFEQKTVTSSVVNESGNGLSNMRGTVGFARSNDPHSGTSQFYVNLADNLDLNPRPTRWGYAVFGKVVEGMDVVDEIGHRPTGPGGPFDRSVPVEAVVVEQIELLP